jgi:inhibitor of cysteine peptidase
MLIAKFEVCVLLAALGLPLTGHAADQPDYQASVLTIPRVDTPEQVGQYQDATLRLGQDGKWQLESLRSLEYNAGAVKLPLVSVEPVVTQSFPVGVYLRTVTYFPDCGYRDTLKMLQRRQDRHFGVAITVAKRPLLPDDGYTCIAMAPVDFQVTIPMDVYGLSAGTYTYDVNGVTGSFTLDSDNGFAGDCKSTYLPNCPP